MPKLRNITGIKQPRLPRGKIVFGIIAGLAVALAVYAAFVIPPRLSQSQAAQALTLATTRQPEHFTELYFSDPESLPKEVEADEPSKFTYRVTNREGRTVTYTTRVILVENGRLKVIQRTTVTLLDGQSKDVVVPFTATTSGHSLELIVELIDQDMSIHFRSQS